MVRAYFLSDLHLSNSNESSEEHRSKVLLQFLAGLKSREQLSHLFLLGDIFDLWVAGHFYFIKKYAEVIRELRRIHDLGVEIHYFEGNHDLYLDHFFGSELGFKIHSGPAHFDFDGFRVRVEHGDQMDPEDRGYIFLRWFLRTPLMKWLAPRLPGWAVVRLGESMSGASRKYTSSVKTISTDRARGVIRSHAQKVWAEEPYDLLVCGHVHVREDFEFDVSQLGLRQHLEKSSPAKRARVINLGTWLEKPCVLFLDGSRVTVQEI